MLHLSKAHTYTPVIHMHSQTPTHLQRCPGTHFHIYVCICTHTEYKQILISPNTLKCRSLSLFSDFHGFPNTFSYLFKEKKSCLQFALYAQLHWPGFPQRWLAIRPHLLYFRNVEFSFLATALNCYFSIKGMTVVLGSDTKHNFITRKNTKLQVENLNHVIKILENERGGL